MTQLAAELNRIISAGEGYAVIDQNRGQANVIMLKAEFKDDPHSRADLVFDDAEEGDLLLLRARTLVRACTDRDEWDTTHSIWEVRAGKLALRHHKQEDNWRLDSETGNLLLDTSDHNPMGTSPDPPPLIVTPHQWGYFQAVQQNWNWQKYYHAINEIVGVEYLSLNDLALLTPYCRTLDRLIKTEEQVRIRDEAFQAIGNAAKEKLEISPYNPLATLAKSRESAYSDPAQQIIDTFHTIVATTELTTNHSVAESTKMEEAAKRLKPTKLIKPLV